MIEQLILWSQMSLGQIPDDNVVESWCYYFHPPPGFVFLACDLYVSVFNRFIYIHRRTCDMDITHLTLIFKICNQCIDWTWLQFGTNYSLRSTNVVIRTTCLVEFWINYVVLTATLILSNGGSKSAVFKIFSKKLGNKAMECESEKESLFLHMHV
jgi:hypothetical protein